MQLGALYGVKDSFAEGMGGGEASGKLWNEFSYKRENKTEQYWNNSSSHSAAVQ